MILLTIKGNPPSKSNCYRAGAMKGAKPRPYIYKAKGLKDYEKAFALQVPDNCKIVAAYEMRVTIICYFDSRRPDLDNAAKSILDCLQLSEVIKDDRSVMELVMYKKLSKENPRVEISIKKIKKPTDETKKRKA